MEKITNKKFEIHMHANIKRDNDIVTIFIIYSPQWSHYILESLSTCNFSASS